MLQVAFLGYFTLAVFVAVMFLKVESWGWRLALLLIVGGLYHWVGLLAAMVAAALFSVVALIAAQLPVTSRM